MRRCYMLKRNTLRRLGVLRSSFYGRPTTYDVTIALFSVCFFVVANSFCIQP